MHDPSPPNRGGVIRRKKSAIIEEEEDRMDGVGDESTEMDVETKSRRNVSPNSFAAKKTVAQGMMDIALITANANQLRYLIEFQKRNAAFYAIFTLIILSLLLQVVIGILLIFKRKYDMDGQKSLNYANKINNVVVVAVFLVTIFNVFIASFSISGDTPVSTT